MNAFETGSDLLPSTSDSEHSFVPFKGNNDVVLLVNNLGSVNELELSGIVVQARKAVQARGFRVLRVLSGVFMVGLPSAHALSADEPQYWILDHSSPLTSSARATSMVTSRSPRMEMVFRYDLHAQSASSAKAVRL